MVTAAITTSASEEQLRLHMRLILSIWVGLFGIDRFYNKQVGWGVVKLITFGGAMIWWIIDVAYFAYKAAETWKK